MAAPTITRDFGGLFGTDGTATEIAGIPITPVVALAVAAIVFAVLWKKLGKK
jgi:hypothetical protein